MAIDVTNFLFSLAAAMAGTAQPVTPAIVVGTNLFVHEGVEAVASTTYAVLRCYGGPPPEELWRIDRISLQLAAASKNATAATRLAWQLYESLRVENADGDSRPRYDWDFAGKLIDGSGALAVDPSTTWRVCLVTTAAPPGLVGRDDRGMWQCSFNFDVRFASVAIDNP